MKAIYVLILTIICNQIVAQETTDNSEFEYHNQSIIVDTIVEPDYIDMYISVGEYSEYFYEKKTGSYEVLITCDSLKKTLSKNIQGITNLSKLTLASVSDKKIDYSQPPRVRESTNPYKVETYYIKLENIEQARLIYENLKFEGLYGIKSQPIYSSEKINQIKGKLKNKAIIISNNLIKEYCDNKDLEINRLLQVYESTVNSGSIISNQSEQYNIKLQIEEMKFQFTVRYELRKK